MTTKDEDSVVRCSNSSVLGTRKWFFISNCFLFNSTIFFWSHLHDVEFSIWLNLSVGVVFNTSEKKVVVLAVFGKSVS
jgi:hypothetical protein